MAWSRDTPWRQGSVLDPAALKALKLNGGATSWAVVITHDCDLANANLEVEPFVEIIICEELTAPKKEYLSGSYGRELHARFEDSEGGSDLALSLRHARREVLRKDELEDGLLRPQYKLGEKDKQILREWLSKRYNRHALPES